MNKEYNFLSEAFWRSLGKFIADDARFTKNRWVGKGRKYVNKARRFHKKHNLGNDVSGTATNMMGQDMVPTRKFQDVDKYLNSESNWKDMRSELWGETKALPRKAWNKTKRIFTRNNDPINNYAVDSNGNIIPYVAAAGLGTLGFTTLANDPNV